MLQRGGKPQVIPAGEWFCSISAAVLFGGCSTDTDRQTGSPNAYQAISEYCQGLLLD